MGSGALGKRDAEARWRRLVEDQRVSGLPVSVFCRERGIPQSSLFAWRRRLAAASFKAVTIAPGPLRTSVTSTNEDAVLPAARPVELPAAGESPTTSHINDLAASCRERSGPVEESGSVGLSAASPIELPAASPVELLLRGDRRLLVRPGFDARLLLDLIEVLESLR